MEHLQSRAGRLLKAGIASNTRLAYTTGLNAFQKFRTEYELGQAWPATEQHVVLFIAYGFETGLAPSSITTYLAGVNYYHKLHHWYDINNLFVVQKVLEGCRRGKAAKDNRAPISRTVLIAICDKLRQVCYDQYEANLFHALFTLAYFGLFRVSELVLGRPRGEQANNLQVQDMQLGPDKVNIILRTFKTKQRGQPSTIKLPSDKNKLICPVRALQNYMTRRPDTKGPLFCHINTHPVTRQQFSGVLAKCIAKTKYAQGHFRSHSFRIGRATDLAAQGASNETIMHMGRWRSDCFKGYVRPNIGDKAQT